MRTPWPCGGFLEVTHQQLYGNVKVLTPTIREIVEASRQEVEAVTPPGDSAGSHAIA